VINACGPWVDQHNQLSHQQTQHRHAFSKGIHLIVDRITPSERVLTFFADDGRLFFVIPMGPKTCIGTTDTRVETPETQVTAEDRKFVLDNINSRLNLTKPLTEASIIAERCGVRPLVVEGAGAQSEDWLQMSRKHAIELDAKAHYLSIYGGKLTDCINIGNEVADIVATLDVKMPWFKKVWYGEPHANVKAEFYHQAELMGLDAMTAKTSSEKLTHRFWRRYGAQAFEMLENIRANPSAADLLIENAEYVRCEIEQAARREMITKLEDFLRRRSKISLVVKNQDLAESAGLKEACRILFGDKAEQKYDEYFNDRTPGES
jgi:glycerol-3-phosphate dehydrogenase